MPRKQKEVKGRKPRKTNVILGFQNLSLLGNPSEIALDIETSGLSPWKDKIAVITIASPDGIILIDHVRGRISKEMKEFIATRNLIIGHNLVGFDFLCMLNSNIDVLRPLTYDTMASELALLSTDRRDVSASLKSTVARRTGTALSKDADHSGWMNPELTEQQLKYCAEDVLELFRLKNEQAKTADPGQQNAIDVENALVPAIAKMVFNGIPVDEKKLRKYIKNQSQVVTDTTKRLDKALGVLNLASPVQVKKALAAAGNAKSQNWEFKSTDKQTLEDQAKFGGDLGNICGDILELRHASKRISMYDDDWMNKYIINGKIHPRIWTCSTDTGRMSSSEPNSQQLPRDMRQVFGNVSEHKMIWADYSQLEVRIAAQVADCPGLRAIFASGMHVHTMLASEAFGVPYKDVTEAMKQLAKGLTFLVLFGGEYTSFYEYAKRAGYDLSLAEALKIFKRFFERCPGMAKLKAWAKAEAMRGRTRPVILRLPTGLKRVLIGWKASPSRIMNTMIQGGAAAGFKFAVLEAHNRGLTDYLVAPVHDELVGCVPNKMEKEFKAELKEAMEVGMAQVTSIPCPVEVKSNIYWGK